LFCHYRLVERIRCPRLFFQRVSQPLLGLVHIDAAPVETKLRALTVVLEAR
jgi:hypothetical protein